MSDTFTVDEVFRIAEQIELNGIEFYTAAAEQTDDPPGRALLAELAEMERGHLRIFGTMRAELGAADFRPDPEGDAMQYLKALASSRIFELAARAAPTGRASMPEILRIAVAAEKDSVTFYLGIMSMLNTARDRERVNRIIAEEMKHVTMLSAQLNRVGGGDNWSNVE